MDGATGFAKRWGMIQASKREFGRGSLRSVEREAEGHRVSPTERGSRQEAGGRPTLSQRNLLGFAFGFAVGGRAREGLTSHDAQQSLARSRPLGSVEGRHRLRPCRRRSGARHFHRPHPSTGRDGKEEARDRCLGRSRGGLTTKIHTALDKQGRPIELKTKPGLGRLSPPRPFETPQPCMSRSEDNSMRPYARWRSAPRRAPRSCAAERGRKAPSDKLRYPSNGSGRPIAYPCA